MKGLVLKAYKEFAWEEVPKPEPGPSEVIVKIEACSICGSDVHGMDGSSGRRVPPVIMGHEASGVVAELGNAVTDWKVGDPVTFDSTIYCGTCRFCRKGQTNLCDNRTVLGVSCDEYRRNGAFAEFIAVPEHILFKLPEGMPFEHAALLEPLSVATHAVSLAAEVTNRSHVVIGCGTIGLLIIQVLRVHGAGTIIGVDLEQDRLDMASTMGAGICLKPDAPDFAERILELTEGRGADVAFEAVGATGPVRTGIDSLRKGGTIVLVGNLAPDVNFPAQKVVTREISVLGSCAQSGEYEDCIAMASSGKVDLDPIISAKAPMSEGGDWFTRLYNKEKGLLKVVLIP